MHPIPTAVIDVAAGRAPADLVLTRCRIINVFTGRIDTGTIAIKEGIIAGIGDYNGLTEQDMAGRFAAPGFIDPHLHIESSMTTPAAFVRAVLPRGTTTVVADPHEIANVLGAKGIQYMLDAAQNQPMNLYYTLPSCVPATDMETAGARLDAGALSPMFRSGRVLGLGEMMNFPGVIGGAADPLEKITAAHLAGRRIEGHAPGVTGPALNAYRVAGISSDHECTGPEEAWEKLGRGMHIMVREGTGAKNLADLLPAITDQTWHRMMWCTDDRHPHDILTDGHIDHIVRKAIRLGLDPIMAIRMATLNPARYFGLHHLGAIAPGRRADLVIFSDLQDPRPEAVYAAGRPVAGAGRFTDPDAAQSAPLPSPGSIMNVPPGSVRFDMPAEGRMVRVIQMVPGQILTGRTVEPAPLRSGTVCADPDRDLLKIAVIDRYSGNGRTGLGLVRGVGLQRGAIASTVAHDAHNIMIIGASDSDMAAALSEIIAMKGGMAVVAEGRVLARLPLPVAGLMADAPMAEVKQDLDRLTAAAQGLGSRLADPFMAISFLALPVIPALKLTDRGLVDVERFRLVSLFADQPDPPSPT